MSRIKLVPKIKLVKSLHEELHMPAKKRRTRSMSVTASLNRSLHHKGGYNK